MAKAIWGPQRIGENRPFGSEKELTNISTIAQGLERGALEVLPKCQIILLMFIEGSLHSSQDSGYSSEPHLHCNPMRQ